jgi:L-rhamnonate dehydratase
MKIASVRAFELNFTFPPRGEGRTPPRRRAWLEDAEVAGPMSVYPRFKRLRASWRPRWPMVGCLVTAADGTWGLGMSSYGRPVAAIVNDHLGPLLVGEDCVAVERAWDLMTRAASPYSPAGLASYAISAIDLALWDLKGKLLGRPVYELLGGPARDRIVCYATGNDTDWHLELGFRATKLACPYGPADGLTGLAENEALVARTRELVGPEVEMMLDCWMAFDVEYAVRLAERLRPYGLRWIEDCLIPEDLDAHVALRERLPWQGLATGEHWYGVHSFAFAASRRLADVFQPDVLWVGGATATARVCRLAGAAGIAVMPHAGLNTPYGQHLGMAMREIPWGELFLGSAPGVPLDETVVLPGTAVPRDGYLVPSGAPGFGLEITLDWLERVAVR